MPFCSSCGEEIKPNSNFCSKCGSYVGDIVPTSSLEEGTAVSAKPSSELADTNKVSDYSSFYASIWTRFWAILVDGIISYALFFGITLMMFQIIPTSSYDFALAFSIVIMWGYYVILEGIFGQTVGKKLLHIKVIKEDRSQCDLTASFIRNLLRFIDILPWFYIIGILSISASKKCQRIGDRVAKTIVVKIN